MKNHINAPQRGHSCKRSTVIYLCIAHQQLTVSRPSATRHDKVSCCRALLPFYNGAVIANLLASN